MSNAASQKSSDWIGVEDLMIDTGLSRNTIYGLAKNNELPVPVVKIGRKYFISRRAWQAVKDHMDSPASGTFRSEGSGSGGSYAAN